MTYEIHVKLSADEMRGIAIADPVNMEVRGVWYPVVYGIENVRMTEAIHALWNLEHKNPTRRYRIIETHYQSRPLDSTPITEESE